MITEPWTAEHLFHMAQLAIKGMRRHGKEPTHLAIHPKDWELIGAYARKASARDRAALPLPRRMLYGYPVKLDEAQDRGDVRAYWEPVV